MDEAELSDSKFQMCPGMLVELQKRCKSRCYETAFAEMSRLAEVSPEKSFSCSGEVRGLGLDDLNEEGGRSGGHFCRMVGMIHSHSQHD